MTDALPSPRYARPDSVAEALSLLAEHGEQAYPVAGGTDLLVRMRAGDLSPGIIVDLGRLGWNQVSEDAGAGRLIIGATCTMAALQRHELVGQKLPALVTAAAALGATQIQHMATVGGNICNASPAADAACALLALGGEVLLRSSAGQRSLPLADFFRGPGQTARQPDELLEAVSVPDPTAAQGRVVQGFHKFGGRLALTCSLANFAGVTRLADDGKVLASRLALGAVGPTILLAEAASGRLVGKALSVELAQEIAASAAAEATPINDHRATGDYRRRLIAALVREHLEECLLP